MVRTSNPSCIENPATRKPYTRHLWKESGLGVSTYFRDGAPATYWYEHTCSRCGFKRHGSY